MDTIYSKGLEKSTYRVNKIKEESFTALTDQVILDFENLYDAINLLLKIVWNNRNHLIFSVKFTLISSVISIDIFLRLVCFCSINKPFKISCQSIITESFKFSVIFDLILLL